MLKVYKASAGSGKTFRLVAEYLKLIFVNEFNYRHILAVTFTNKATAEMKERVIGQLYAISSDPSKSPYTAIISEETGLRAEELQNRANLVLRNILHDFNRFSVSTIDKFTQKVIKAFNRELGIAPSYSIELDNEILLEEATDRLILKAGTDRKLRKWLTRMGKERLMENKSFVIKDEILILGKELFKEKFQDCFATNKGFYSRKNLKKYRQELNKIIEEFEVSMKEKGYKGLKIISENDLAVDDFSFGNTGVASTFQKIIDKQFNFGSRITEAAIDSGKWVKKDHKRRIEILALVENKLLPLLTEILEYCQTHYPDYVTARIIASNLYTLGILNDLQLEIEVLLHEKGVLLLSDSNLLLKKIIAGSDSPFIYEKTGNQYNHFMLDEFQDTSALQWENFKPLIENSMAGAKSNIAVGDVKQSIYRWRNSDWNILANRIEREFNSQQIKISDLTKNWRSDSNIVSFNNSFFQEILNHVPHFSNATGLENIYTGTEQQCAKETEKTQGYVSINFLGKDQEDGFKDCSLLKLLEQVKELQDNGYTGKDIAILVRKNEDGRNIIRYFLEAASQPENKVYNLEIISNESLFLNSSGSVIFVIQFLNHLVNPTDKITKANLLNEYNIYIRPTLIAKGFISLPGISEQENNQPGSAFEEEFNNTFGHIVESIKTKTLNASIDEVITIICDTLNLFSLEHDLPFLQALIDQAARVKSIVANDYSGFLKWWDENGYKLSVNVNDDSDSIRLLTIHKSKGLEFKAVLIPFFNWQVSWGNKAPLLWCEANKVPFNILPLVPVTAKKEMEQSIFREEYKKEEFENFVDNLNLVYVAFTRAISVLIINTPYDPERKMKTLINSFLLDTILGMNNRENLFGSWDDTSHVFRFGSLTPNIHQNQMTNNDTVLSEYCFSGFDSRLKLRTQPESFFDESGANKNFGILVHEILSSVEVAADVEKACRQALNQQKVRTSEYPGLIGWLKNLVGSEVSKEWFSGEYKILNERSIISPSATHRPDRVMVKGSVAIVVDYKLGETNNREHSLQVERYAANLKEIGFKEVTGYLWYLLQNKVEKICRF